jgi:hypothetical protein
MKFRRFGRKRSCLSLRHNPGPPHLLHRRLHGLQGQSAHYREESIPALSGDCQLVINLVTSHLTELYLLV